MRILLAKSPFVNFLNKISNLFCFTFSLKTFLLAALAANVLFSCVANVNEPGIEATVPMPQITYSLSSGGATVSSVDFGTVPVFASQDLVIYLKNTGAVGAFNMAVGTALNVPFSFKGGTYPGTGGDCADQLAVSDVCFLVVNFSPIVASSSSQDLRLTYTTDSGLGPVLLGVARTFFWEIIKIGGQFFVIVVGEAGVFLRFHFGDYL